MQHLRIPAIRIGLLLLFALVLASCAPGPVLPAATSTPAPIAPLVVSPSVPPETGTPESIRPEVTPSVTSTPSPAAPTPIITATPQETPTTCPDLPDGDLIGTTTQAGNEITYANPVLGVELTYPDTLSLYEDQYLSGAYGFIIMPAGEEEAMFRVSWLREYRPDQLETRVQEIIEAAPTIDIQRSDTTVDGQPAVALANAPSRAPAIIVYVAANDKLYEIIYNVDVLDEQFNAILESIRFVEPTLPLDCLNSPMAATLPQETPSSCPNLPDGDLIGTTTQVGNEITYANPVVGVELTFPDSFIWSEPQYLFESYGFSIAPAELREPSFNVGWLHEYRPDQLEARAQYMIEAFPTIDVQRREATVGGYPAVALAPVPGMTAGTYFYVTANDRLYEIIVGQEVLDEQFNTILESIRFFEPTLPLDCLNLPPAD